MSKLEKYYINHKNAVKFPWTLYHRPLIHDLYQFLSSFKDTSKNILVIGPGSLHEFECLKDYGLDISVLDIDPRVIKDLKIKHGNKISNYFLSNSKFENYPEKNFDLIYAKEVIEHIVDYKMFLQLIHRSLKPGGNLWLSTPNYGFFLLPLIESTVLEFIARINGYSRKNIHPTKFSPERLSEALNDSGLELKKINTTKFNLAITAWASKKST